MDEENKENPFDMLEDLSFQLSCEITEACRVFKNPNILTGRVDMHREEIADYYEEIEYYLKKLESLSDEEVLEFRRTSKTLREY